MPTTFVVMNVFVLCTGRNGSMSLVEACKHMTNYSSGHETQSHRFGNARLDYPAVHIEADNRLSWFLGRLDERYGNSAAYVHLLRDEEATARSYLRRWESGIMLAYHGGMLQRLDDSKLTDADRLEVCVDYCQTVNSNIRHFLRDKPRRMVFRLENATEDFDDLWSFVAAEGDKEAALKTWSHAHNASREGDKHRGPQSMASLRGQLGEKSDQVRASNARIKQLRAKLEKSNDRNAKVHKAQSVRIQELRTKLETVKQQRADLSRQLTALSRQLTALSRQLTAQRSEASRAALRTDQIQVQLDVAKARSEEQRRLLVCKNKLLVQIDGQSRA